MALESGPESRVRTPGAKDSEESSEVAKVRVTKGRDKGSDAVVSGRRDSSMAAEVAGKLSSDMLYSFFTAYEDQEERFVVVAYDVRFFAHFSSCSVELPVRNRLLLQVVLDQ